MAGGPAHIPGYIQPVYENMRNQSAAAVPWNMSLQSGWHPEAPESLPLAHHCAAISLFWVYVFPCFVPYPRCSPGRSSCAWADLPAASHRPRTGNAIAFDLKAVTPSGVRSVSLCIQDIEYVFLPSSCAPHTPGYLPVRAEVPLRLPSSDWHCQPSLSGRSSVQPWKLQLCRLLHSKMPLLSMLVLLVFSSLFLRRTFLEHISIL